MPMMKHNLIGTQSANISSRIAGQCVVKSRGTRLALPIKLIHLHRVGSASVIDRFNREAKVIATLRHPGIVQVFDFEVDTERDIFYMVMEFVPGETLGHRRQYAARRAFATEEALRFA
jgi:serine/threonine protein kinase